MSKAEVAKTLMQVANLLYDESNEFETEQFVKGKEMLSKIYDTIRYNHIEYAIVKNNIETAFDLIFTPGKYYNKIHKEVDDIYYRLWKHYGYEFYPGDIGSPMIETPAPPSFVPLFLNYVLFGNYTPLAETFNDWYIDENLRDKIDQLINLIKNIQINQSVCVDDSSCEKASSPVKCYENIDKLIAEEKLYEAFIEIFDSSLGDDEVYIIVKNALLTNKTNIAYGHCHSLFKHFRWNPVWKYKNDDNIFDRLKKLEQLFKKRIEDERIAEEKILQEEKQKELLIKIKQNKFDIFIKNNGCWKFEQRRVNNDWALSRLPLGPFSLQDDAEFIKMFWKYIDENNGFSKCPICNKEPTVVRKYSHGVWANGLFNLQSNVGVIGNNECGVISHIHCCGHYFDFVNKKRYVSNRIYKGSLRGGVTLPDNGTTTSLYIIYDPDDPYGEKGKQDIRYSHHYNGLIPPSKTIPHY